MVVWLAGQGRVCRVGYAGKSMYDHMSVPAM